MEAVLNPIFSHGNIRNIIHAQLTQLASKAETFGRIDEADTCNEHSAKEYKRGAQAMKEKVLEAIKNEPRRNVGLTMKQTIIAAITNISLSE